jgi:hypothetical protein
MVVYDCDLSCWEVEIRRVTIQGNLGQKVTEISSQSKKPSVVAHTCNNTKYVRGL